MSDKPQPIRPRDYVKVRLQDGENSERIWCEVLACNVENQTMKMRIDNRPVSKAYARNEVLEDIPVTFVLDVLKREDMNKERGDG